MIFCGYIVVGIYNGFIGLVIGDMLELVWSDVEGWVGEGGVELGICCEIFSICDFYVVSCVLEDYYIDVLFVIGGYLVYEGIYIMMIEWDWYLVFCILMVCILVLIDNNFFGLELFIGIDIVFNVIVEVMDKIKELGIVFRCCFVVEMMGCDCGYFVLMLGIVVGVEWIYINEDGIFLDDLVNDVYWLWELFVYG